MDFIRVFQLIIENFESKKIDFALIGGFALNAVGISRSTQDVDFLINKKQISEAEKILTEHGYHLAFESEDVKSFIGIESSLGRIDFILAHRNYALAMLKRAVQKSILNNRYQVKVIIPEDLIGLKVQSSSNDPGRYHQDMSDIENIIRLYFNQLDLLLVKDYFQLFERSAELEEIRKRINPDAV